MELKLIRVNNVSKIYKKKNILSNINFSINVGEICAVIGKNGAGKSTLFKLFTQQIKANTGEIIYIGSSKIIKPTIGSIIEQPTFFDNFSAFENLCYFYLQKYGKIDKKEILKVLKIINLPDSTKKFSDFSLGMKQRLGIGLALLFRPVLLVLDEPVNGLDPEGIRDVRNILLKINQKYETTILISSHILSELEEIATDYIFLDKGYLLEKISKTELMKKQKNYLEISVNKPKDAAEILNHNFPDVSILIGNNKIRITDYAGNPADINKILVISNIEVQKINSHKMSLEEYFFEKVR
ncbi:ATP-binding cassette domain-containing protein [Vagococcus fluvialis]|uniref:ATP-binding cassette domain-containing protein n=1 Tax=Vagococcus fluvialis TaxID=2738 RepID=UPI00203385B1|nr:ATP-binding cassette domain-containing protein [Vagococcus fluvialis]MCM2139859.1 ATP-binding cassette domain-containing protein [Vagococcus fluvialis]URZ88904.1 vagococcin T immunity protein vcnF [Vagococcus fluvialis]